MGLLRNFTCFFLLFAPLVTAFATSQLQPAQPLSLKQAEDLALDHNKSLRAQRKSAEQGGLRYKQARAKYFPTVRFSAFAKETDKGAGIGYEDSMGSSVRLDQIIFSSSVYHGAKLSDLDAKLLFWDLVLLENSVLFDVRTTYYSVLLAQGQVDVQKQNIDLLAEAATREERKRELGEATLFDVRQSQVTVTNALFQYYRANRELNEAKNRLLNLFGEDASMFDQLILVKSNISRLTVPFLVKKLEKLGVRRFRNDNEERKGKIMSSEEVVQLATQRRVFSVDEMNYWESLALKHQPAIQSSRVSVTRATRAVKQKYGAYTPDIGLYGKWSNNSQGSVKSFGEAGLSLSWTIFDSGQREYGICEFKSALEEANILLKQSLQATEAEIHDRFFELEEALLSYFSADQSVYLAEEAIEQAKNRRSIGVITPLEYRDALQSLTEARQTLNQASFDLLKSYYALWNAVGVSGEAE